MRWFRGLLPTLTLLVLALCAALVVWLDTAGLPSAACRALERELARNGVPVSVARIRVGVLSGLTLKIDDLQVRALIDGSERTICRAESVRVNFSLIRLLQGERDLNHVQIQDGEIGFPAATDNARALHVDNIQLEASLNDAGIVLIEEARFTAQGMPFSLEGGFDARRLLAFSGKGASSGEFQDMVNAGREHVSRALTVFGRFTWLDREQPPVWHITLSQSESLSLGVRLELDAKLVQYGQILASDIDLQTYFNGKEILIERLNVQTASPRGSFRLQGHCDLVTGSSALKLDSINVDLLHYAELLGGRALLPSCVDLKSLPSLNLEAACEVDFSQRSVTNIKLLGQAKVDAFQVGAHQMNGASMNFSYQGAYKDKEDRFYLDSLQVRAPQGTMTASVLREGGIVRTRLDSEWPPELILGLAGALSNRVLEIPQGIEIIGNMELNAEAELDFSRGWELPPSSVALHLLKWSFDEIGYKGVKLGGVNLAGEASADGSSFRDWTAAGDWLSQWRELSLGFDLKLFQQASLGISPLRTFSLNGEAESFSCRGEPLGSLMFSLEGNPEAGSGHGGLNLRGEDGRGELTARADLKDRVLTCTLDSAYSPQFFQRACGQEVQFLEGLTLPETSDLHAAVELSLSEEDLNSSPLFAILRHAEVDAVLSDMAYHGEPITEFRCKGRIGPSDEGKDAVFSLSELSLSNGSGSVNLNKVEGAVFGKTSIEGSSTMRADSFARMIQDAEVQRVVNEYFEFNEKSAVKVTSFKAEMDTLDPQNSFALRGNVELSDLRFRGADVQKATAGIEVAHGDVQKEPAKTRVDASSRILLKKPKIIYDNRAWLASKKIQGDKTSVLNADYVLFNLKENTIEVQNIAGEVYMPYSLRMFTPAGARALSEFHFLKPVFVSGWGTYPLSDDMSRMRSSLEFSTKGEVHYPLFGTTLELKPLGGGKISGRVDITPKWVNVAQLSAECWRGKVVGNLQIQIDESGDALNGEFAADGMSLSAIARSFNSELHDAEAAASIAFTSKGGRLATLKGEGKGAIRNGNLLEFPFLGMIGRLLNKYIPGIEYVIDYNIQEATWSYELGDKYIVSNNLRAVGTNLSLDGNGSVSLDDLTVNSHLRLRFPNLSFAGVALLPVRILTAGMFVFHGTGPLSDINWRMTPYSGGNREEMKIPDQQKPAKKKR